MCCPGTFGEGLHASLYPRTENRDRNRTRPQSPALVLPETKQQASQATSESPRTSHKEKNLQTPQLFSVFTLRLCASVFQQDREVHIILA